MDKEGTISWMKNHFIHCSKVKKQASLIDMVLKENGLTRDNITVMTLANGINDIYSNIVINGDVLSLEVNSDYQEIIAKNLGLISLSFPDHYSNKTAYINPNAYDVVIQNSTLSNTIISDKLSKAAHSTTERYESVMAKLGKDNSLNVRPKFIGNEGYIQRTAEEHQSIIDQMTDNIAVPLQEFSI